LVERVVTDLSVAMVVFFGPVEFADHVLCVVLEGVAGGKENRY